MTFLSRLSFLGAVTLFSATCFAQFDQNIMMKWAAVTTVKYHIEGEYRDSGTIVVKGGNSGKGDVSDRVEILLTWDQTSALLVGEPVFKNFKSGVKNLQNLEKKCDPPILTGPYEHFTLTGLENGLGGYLHMTATREYAPANVVVMCAGKREAIPAAKGQDIIQLQIPAPTLLAMPAAAGSTLQLDPANDTIITRDGGWTWTYKLAPGD